MNKVSNSTTLIGNLGKVPEFKTLQNGGSVCQFSLATSSTYANKQGEKVTETQWHECVAWGKKAETINQYVRKGHKIALQGSLKYDLWTDKNGTNRKTARIYIDDFVLLERKGDTIQVDGQTFPQQNTAPEQQPQPMAADDDDLPF